MPVIAVIGAQWGDEGKGKIVDLLAEKADVVVRFSGGDNAGHTVLNPLGEFKLHLVPSGIFSPRAVALIGNGVVVNPKVLIEEMDKLAASKVDISRLLVSDRAHLIMPYHLLLDRLEEKARGGKAIGTTGKGIGPAFADKVARCGIRAGDLLDREYFWERLSNVAEQKNNIITRVFGETPLSVDDIYSQYCRYAERLAPHIRDILPVLSAAMGRDDVILLEGAQGTMLDPDFGTYPYTTSSSPTGGGGCLGSGLGATCIKSILGVYKAYCTRVGGGPLPTELHDETGKMIRELAHEYGTTTGRARRCGWFDAVAARFSARINGFTGVAITRLDVFDTFPEMKICVGYRLDGQTIDYFPSSVAALEKCQPVYEEFPGWQSPTVDIRQYDRLPAAARRYLERIEGLIGSPIRLVSVGKERDQTIIKKPVY